MLSLHQVRYAQPGGLFTLSIPFMEIPPVGVTAIVGKNGSGKSTLLSLLAGLRLPQSGTCSYRGINCFSGYDRVKRDVHLLSWNVTFESQLSPADYLRLMRKLRPDWDHAKEERLAGEFALPADQSIGSLSRGEHAKFKLLLSICQRPQVLLIDELTNDLDQASRKSIFSLIDEQVFEGSLSVVWATNILSDVERFANRVIILARGSAVLEADMETLKAGHQRLALQSKAGARIDRLEGIAGDLEWTGTTGLLHTAQFDEAMKESLAAQGVGYTQLPYSLQEILNRYGA